MRRLSEILENATEPAPRPTRRRVGIAVVLLLAALFGWATFKHAATGNLSESEIEAGLDELAVGVTTGEGAAFERAEAHFVDAASVTFVSPYPAFLISTSRRLRAPEPDGGVHDRIARAVLDGDLAAAREQAEALRASSERAAGFWLRLLDELELRLH